jgi:hypothetical protein
MRTEIVELNGQEFKLFYVMFDNEEICVAEEKLDNYIEECIENDLYYGKVRAVDEMYAYCVAQCVADTDDEQEIIDELKVIIDYAD